MRDRESGAAAVEFALVLPVLVLILFGIIDYGLYFSNSIQVRSGVHDAARQYAITPGSSCTNPNGWTPPADAPPVVASLMCQVHRGSGSVTGKSYVAVDLPDGWVVGDELLVCERTDVAGLSGLIPLPGQGQLHAESVVTIEQDASDTDWPASGAWPGKTASGQPPYEDTLPDGNWDWCAP